MADLWGRQAAVVWKFARKLGGKALEVNAAQQLRPLQMTKPLFPLGARE